MGGRVRTAALRHHVARASLAASALGGNTELQLDFVETQASPGVAGYFAIGDATADTNDHGNSSPQAVDDVGKL